MKLTFPMALALLFIGLKLTHNIDWEWLWVLSPIWIPVAACLSFAGLCLFLAGVCHLTVRIGAGKSGYAEWRARQKLADSLSKYAKALKR